MPRIYVADSFCCHVTIGVSRGIGLVEVHYPYDAKLCGRCLLCLLLYQIPANEEPKEEEQP